jgi:SAM-dependent methyltransferase
MGKPGPLFYDDDAVFATYMRHRGRSDTPNDTLEKPVIDQLIGTVEGLRILDLGCGDAAIGRELLTRGAASYHGLEGSANMAALAAQTLHGTAGQVIHTTIEEWDYPSAAFDLAIARLVLHYIADLSALCGQVFQTLAPGGRLIFSVEHPVISSCDRGWPAGTLRQDWIVDDYFDTGLRVTNWLGASVQKYHRTVEDYCMMLQQSGFLFEQLRESRPRREDFHDQQTYERRKRIPLFLFLSGRKPGP